MILGTGKIEVRLMNADGSTAETLVLARPTERVFEDYEDVVTMLPPNAYGESEPIVRGVRFRGHYRWIGHARNQTEMAVIRKIGNWRIGEQFVNLWPHSDQRMIQLRCTVRRHVTQPMNGKVTADIMELEFGGLDILERRPNPVFDRVSRISRRGSVNATNRTFGT